MGMAAQPTNWRWLMLCKIAIDGLPVWLDTVRCPAGTFSETPGADNQTKCLGCSAGSFSTAGSSACDSQMKSGGCFFAFMARQGEQVDSLASLDFDV